MRTKKQQVVDELRRRISEGHWLVGDSLGDLWTLQENSEDLFGVAVSWGTIRQAQQVLVEEGVLSPIRAGVPTRVIAVPPVADAEVIEVAELRRFHLRLGQLYAEFGDFLDRISDQSAVTPELHQGDPVLGHNRHS